MILHIWITWSKKKKTEFENERFLNYEIFGKTKSTWWRFGTDKISEKAKREWWEVASSMSLTKSGPLRVEACCINCSIIGACFCSISIDLILLLPFGEDEDDKRWGRRKCVLRVSS